MQGVMVTVGCISTSVPQPRLIQAAHEFEAQLMKELMRPLTRTGDDESESGSEGTLNDFAGEALGQSLSRSGGFGISASILRSISRNGEILTGNPVAGDASDPSGTALK